jgi:hypothetical protein
MGSCLPVETLASMALRTGWSEQPIGLPAVRAEVELLFATQGVENARNVGIDHPRVHSTSRSF